MKIIAAVSLGALVSTLVCVVLAPKLDRPPLTFVDIAGITFLMITWMATSTMVAVHVLLGDDDD